ncbi:radical SAM protein, partial [Klebsiella oxytoca]
LSKYLPYMESVSVVPVGLSRFREGLYPLKPFTQKEAEETIDLIESWQRRLYEKHGTHFVHASDEFYILAKRPLPEESRYDGYPQLENG